MIKWRIRRWVGENVEVKMNWKEKEWWNCKDFEEQNLLDGYKWEPIDKLYTEQVRW